MKCSKIFVKSLVNMIRRNSYFYEFLLWYIVLHSLTECYITKYTEIKPQKLDIFF